MIAQPLRSHVVDLTKDHDDRRHERKSFASRPKSERHHDNVVFKDLHTTSNYDEFFENCTDKNRSLNTKGPMANLLFKFNSINANRESINEDVDSPQHYKFIHRVSIFDCTPNMLSKNFICYLFFSYRLLQQLVDISLNRGDMCQFFLRIITLSGTSQN